MELYRKYRPQKFEDIVGNEIAIKTLRKELENGSHVFLFTGPAGCGKAQPLDSLVLTKNGYVKMGDVSVGMKILDGKGKETEIEGVYPQGKRDIYKITFNDRTFIKVADNHINRVFWYNQDKREKEYFDLTTIELIDKFNNQRFKLRVDVPIIDCWEESELPIDPYLLGLLIADGSLHNNFGITISEDDIKDKVSNILSEIGYELSYVDNFDYRIIRKEKIVCNQFITDTDGLRYKIKELGLDCKSVDKHIPSKYLYNSFSNRLELLRGLFDGDGFIASNGGYNFDVCSKRLSDDFAFLVRSLGIVDTVSESIAKYKDKNNNIKETSICYKHYLRVPNHFKIFSSEKHNKRWFRKQTEPIRKIEKIEKISNEECQCIYVSSQEHTYLTDNITVTHNTTLARIMAKEVGAGELSIKEINSAENRGIDTAREILEQMRYNPSDGDAIVWILDEMHMITNAGQNALLKALEEVPETVYFALATTDPQKLIAPLKTRCSEIKVKPLTDEEMIFLLKRTARAEKIKMDTEVYERIAELAKGGSRKGMKLLAKVLYLENDEERLNALKGNSDDEENPETIEFCRALSKKTDFKTLTSLLGKIDLSNAETVRMAIMGYMNACILKGNPSAEIVATMQAFSSADTYRNSKFALTVALLDREDLLG